MLPLTPTAAPALSPTALVIWCGFMAVGLVGMLRLAPRIPGHRAHKFLVFWLAPTLAVGLTVGGALPPAPAMAVLLVTFYVVFGLGQLGFLWAAVRMRQEREVRAQAQAATAEAARRARLDRLTRGPT